MSRAPSPARSPTSAASRSSVSPTLPAASRPRPRASTRATCFPSSRPWSPNRPRRHSPQLPTESIRSAAMEHIAQAVDPFVFRLSIFVLAVFVGYFVVWSVTPALHTPLMSVTNAISSVIVVGALLAVGVALVGSGGAWARGFGFVALIFACVNIFGGFLVTQRMLAMYQKKKK